MAIQSNTLNLFYPEISYKESQARFSFLYWQGLGSPHLTVLCKMIMHWNLSHFLVRSTAHRIPNNNRASATRDGCGKWGCSEGHVRTHRQQDFVFLIIHSHAGRQGVYISVSLKLGEEVIPRIKTVADTLFLAVQRGNIKVHTQWFWKIKLSMDGRTCLAKKQCPCGTHIHYAEAPGWVFAQFLTLPS